MRMRIPSFGEIFRPAPDGEEDCDSGEFEMDLGGGSCPLPGERPRSFSFRPSDAPVRKDAKAPPSDFAGVFASLAAGNTRTKPSYTDCWMTNSSDELKQMASYVTAQGSVLVGLSEDGEVEGRGRLAQVLFCVCGISLHGMFSDGRACFSALPRSFRPRRR